jgi:hypothetical protein
MNAVQASVAAIGAPQPEHLMEARRVLEDIPHELKMAARNIEGAEAVVYGLLLSRSTSLLGLQVELLKSQIDATVFDYLSQLREPLSALSPGLRLPLLAFGFELLVRFRFRTAKCLGNLLLRLGMPVPALRFQSPVVFRFQTVAFIRDMLVCLSLPLSALGIELLVGFCLQTIALFRDRLFRQRLPMLALGFQLLVHLQFGPAKLVAELLLDQGFDLKGLALPLVLPGLAFLVRLRFCLCRGFRQALFQLCFPGGTRRRQLTFLLRTGLFERGTQFRQVGIANREQRLHLRKFVVQDGIVRLHR